MQMFYVLLYRETIYSVLDRFTKTLLLYYICYLNCLLNYNYISAKCDTGAN